MKVSLMQPYLFPYVGYFQLVYASDIFVSYDLAQYIRRGWINRNRYLNQGRITMFSINVVKQDITTRILDKKISDSFKLKKSKILRAIEQSYSKSRYFSYFFPVFEKVIMLDTDSISEIALSSIRGVFDYLGVERSIEKSSNLVSVLDNNKTAMEKVVDIVSVLGCATYLNMIGGKELYDSDFFHQNGMDLKFITHRIDEYQQNSSEFIPGLSIIDMLMNVSRDEAISFLSADIS